MGLMAQRLPSRLVLCILLTGLLVLSPGAALAHPLEPDHESHEEQHQPADSPRPPSLMLSVYRWTTASATIGCDLPGGLLAAVGEVASDHGMRTNGGPTPTLDDDGTLRPSLIGPPAGDDTDGGRWDRDQVLDHPVGPFQITPASWSDFGVDANADGLIDPNNAWDSAAAAASLLCALGAGEPEQLDAALSSYFGGDAHVDEVRDKMPGFGSITGRNAVGEPSQLGTYWTDDTNAFLDRWPDTSDVHNATPLTIATGSATETWLVGDWNGDGATTPASYTPNPEGAGLFTFYGADGIQVGEAEMFGSPSAVPLVGDWNADGIDDIGTWVTAGNDGIFFLGSGDVDDPDAEPLIARFGQAGDIPIIGDWDGDGYDGPGIYRPSTATFHLADQRGRPLGAPVEQAEVAAIPATLEPQAGAVFLEAIAATAAGQALTDIGVLDLITEARSSNIHNRYTDEFLADFSAATPLVADWDGDGFSDLGLVRHSPDLTLVERFDVHHHSMGFVELPWSAGVTAGRWEPRPMVTMELDATSVTDITAHEGEDVPLARVGGILVHVDIAEELAAMIDAAAADGITLTGWGWRSHQRQIELRAQNCPDIWESPPSQCSPPTAIPGHSRHESGNAVDFHVDGTALRRSFPEFAWLQEHAADYGFFNLASEPWHWSDTGG